MNPRLQRLLKGLKRHAYHDITFVLLVILNGVLNDIEQNYFIKLPVREYLDIRREVLDQPNVDFSLVNLMLKGPEHVPYRALNGDQRSLLNSQLVFLQLHPLDLVSIVVPHSF